MTNFSSCFSFNVGGICCVPSIPSCSLPRPCARFPVYGDLVCAFGDTFVRVLTAATIAFDRTMFRRCLTTSVRTLWLMVTLST
jgi:hypothetical protein